MPYKSSKIKIEKTSADRRVKLTAEDKEEIKSIYANEDIGYGKLAELFGVSKRTVYWIINPDKQKENVRLRAERGGSKQYYDRKKQNDYMKNHRRYKHKLYSEGKIKDDESAKDND